MINEAQPNPDHARFGVYASREVDRLVVAAVNAVQHAAGFTLPPARVDALRAVIESLEPVIRERLITEYEAGRIRADAGDMPAIDAAGAAPLDDR